jgi:signal transduction histidine kinase
MTETTPIGHRTAAGTGLVLACACLLAAGSAVLAVTDRAPGDRPVAITVQALCILLPVALGLARLTYDRSDRFARLLIGAGFLWALTALAQSPDSVLYSVGRTSVWVVEVAIVYLLLAFPDGHLHTRAERRTFGAVALLAGVLYVPTALVAEFPTPAPWSGCGTDCPSNALLAWHGPESIVADVIQPLRELLTVALFATVAALLVRRARAGPRLVRRMLVPVAGVAVLRCAVLAAYDLARKAGASSGALELIGTLFVLSLAFVTVGFAVGLLSRRLFVADALQRLTQRLKPHAGTGELKSALADALEDPTLQVAYRVNGDSQHWVDDTGWPVAPPADGEGQSAIEVTAEGRHIAAIVHDEALAQNPALVRAAASYALTAMENERLVGELNSSLEELSQSRSRIVAVADAERRKIERNLHDGAQQRLVALRVRLELVAERLEAEAPVSAHAVRELEVDVDQTIDEVRSFARGIYPSLLTERGLTEALRAAGRSAPIPTTINAGGIGRFPGEVEATVYFACMEALQNAAKHARASGVTIAVTRNPHLHFEVSDDGIGFDPGSTNGGTGLTNLGDRLAAAGGTLSVTSPPGNGTRITGEIPAEA